MNATVRYHLATYDQTTVVQELTDNLYVDDWLSGANTLTEAQSSFTEARKVMLEAGMLLAKWSSNSSSLTDKVSAELGSKYIEGEHIKILAVKWTPLGDIFTFGGIDIATDIAPTKRIVLGCIARLFDHFGFLSPFIMTAKCLFQELWQIGIDKDESRPASLLCFFSESLG